MTARTVLLACLDQAQAELTPRALSGDVAAAKTTLHAMDTRAALLGLDNTREQR